MEGKVDHLVAGREKREGEGNFFMKVFFAFKFKSVYTKSESDLFGTSYFFKLTFNKGVVSYTNVVLLKKTSFIEDRFNILLSVHQVVRIVLGGARIRGNSRKRVLKFNPKNIKFGIFGNDNLGGGGVGLQLLKR